MKAFLIALGLILAGYVGAGVFVRVVFVVLDRTTEVSAYRYSNVAEIAKEEPSLRVHVDEFMRDGWISVSEADWLDKRVGRLELQRQLSKQNAVAEAGP